MSLLGGIEIALEDTLVDYILEWTKDDYCKIKRNTTDPSYSDSTTDEIEMGPPGVFPGMLPMSEIGVILTSAIPTYPFILSHITKGKDMMPEGCIYTKLIFGVWDDSPDYQGYRDCVALMRKVMRKIWYVNTLAESYQINMDEGSEYRVYDSNQVSWPFFMCECVFGWRMRTPIAAFESEGLDFQPEPDIILGNRANKFPTRTYVFQPPNP